MLLLGHSGLIGQSDAKYVHRILKKSFDGPIDRALEISNPNKLAFHLRDHKISTTWMGTMHNFTVAFWSN
jgi:hypothetical protein